MKVADIRRLDKIREIEERIVNCETNILRNPNEILRRVICIMDDSGQLSVCSTFYWLSLLYVQKQKRRVQGLRWLGNIDNQACVEVVKKFLDLGMQIRHTKNIPINFSVTYKSDNNYDIVVALYKVDY